MKSPEHQVVMYAVYWYGDHDGCPDDWSNMHDESLLGVFETMEMAKAFIMVKAKIEHKELEIREGPEFTDQTAFPVKGFAKYIEEDEWAKDLIEDDSDWGYEESGWKIEKIDVYLNHWAWE